jgi:pimeloyl-ACP methyl ester carboxylesterase
VIRRLFDLLWIVVDRLYAIRQQVRHALGPHASTTFPGGDLPPVLLLPGVYETWQFLRPVAERLHELGHPVHVLPELGHNRRTIAATAAIAQAYLDRNDLHEVILVAHSKGGLVGKHMMVTDDTSGRISSLIAICSPFGGSSLARFAPNPALRAFSPRNPTLSTLAANLEANSRITSIFSRLDPLIPGGSSLEGATNIEIDLVGHFLPLTSGRVIAAISKAISPNRQ